ncbi:sugar transferase [Leptolyngbya sp. FACHB-36]|uniref:heterocyst development glycosyltransferase HepC n=1 Tax=Leptolyngbya sp. FACHB-36 TaxID=2692808 RepID=UPI0016814FA5|nr:heterocyst development glycosyltransferase HepC [Leptolyngbya sp. FACHB-36]MBD2020808.1 sugar transferase [Leptolyngbya sp. FACHB-36]
MNLPSLVNRAPSQLSPILSNYLLKWRQDQLLVTKNPSQTEMLPSFEAYLRLVACIDRSPVKLVRLSSTFGEREISLWANACSQAGKAVFLQVPNTATLPKKQAGFSWRLKRAFDLVLATLLLLLLGPVLLTIALIIRLDSPGPILFQQWRVGERGKLFRIFKFRTMIVGAEALHHQVMGNQSGLHKHTNDPRLTSIGRWLRKYSLDELPQLFNVLRGEMSLVGPRPWALYDAVRISPDMRQRLNALPGITGSWQVTSRSNLLDLNAVNRHDLDYLSSWSLWQDIKILLMTLPKVISGFGAY